MTRKQSGTIPVLSPRAQRHLVDVHMGENLVSFLQRTFETVVPGEELHLNWHIEAIAYELDLVLRGKTKRLIITVPPRSLKSIMVSVAFPAFVLGHSPSKKIVCASYAGDLATKHAIDCRRVLQADWYRRIFPETRIGWEKNTETDVMTTRRGGRFATSVGGTLTGRGGDIFIIDDPLKPDEAMSDTSRSKLKSWVESTLMSRLNDKVESSIIVVMQRLHVDDLVGVLLEKGGWRHLNLPAIGEVDEHIPLYGGRHFHRRAGAVLDRKREPRSALDDLKADMGSMAFSAQYQQSPIPAEGNMIRRDWLRFYERLPAPAPGDIEVTSWDTAMTASQIADYTAATTWVLKGDYCYLVDLVRDRFEFPDLKRAVLAAKARSPRAHILIENKGSGMSLIQQLRSEGTAVIPINAAEDKTTRLFATQPMFEAGSILFPKHAPWLDGLMTELLAFPHYRNDDQVDSVSQALSWIAQRRRMPQYDDIFVTQV